MAQSTHYEHYLYIYFIYSAAKKINKMDASKGRYKNIRHPKTEIHPFQRVEVQVLQGQLQVAWMCNVSSLSPG